MGSRPNLFIIFFATAVAFAVSGCTAIKSWVTLTKTGHSVAPCVPGKNCFGDVDLSFGSQGKAQFYIDGVDNSDHYGQGALAITTDDRVVFGTDLINGAYSGIGISRLTQSGQLDTTFGTGGLARLPISANASTRALLIKNQDIYLSAEVGAVRSLIKLNPAGAIDGSFGTSGILTFPGYTTSDGLFTSGNLLYITGQVAAADNNIAISASDFNGVAASYGTGGTATTTWPGDEFGYGYAVDSTGRVIISTQAYFDATRGFDVGVTRFDLSGNVDGSFGTGGSVQYDFFGDTDATWSVNYLASDSSILLVGETTRGGQSDIFVSKVDGNGNLVSSFANSGSLTLDQSGGAFDFAKVALIYEGKILVFGETTISGKTKVFMLRLTSNGIVDTSFNSSGYKVYSQGDFDDILLGVAIDSQNRLILMAGASNGLKTGISINRIFL